MTAWTMTTAPVDFPSLRLSLQEERRRMARMTAYQLFMRWQGVWPDDLVDVRVEVERRFPTGGANDMTLVLAATWKRPDGSKDDGRGLRIQNLAENRPTFYDPHAQSVLLPLAQAAVELLYDCGELHEVLYNAFSQVLDVTKANLPRLLDHVLTPEDRAHMLAQELAAVLPAAQSHSRRAARL